MKFRNIFLILIISVCACKNKKAEPKEMKFNSTQWAVREERDYVYREKMLKDLMDNHKLHGVKKDSLIHMLGEPDRSNEGYLYYRIRQDRLGQLPTHTVTLVIKLTSDSTVEWRKIHK